MKQLLSAKSDDLEAHNSVDEAWEVRNLQDLWTIDGSWISGLLVLNVGDGWEWGNGIMIDSYYRSFPHSLLYKHQ